MLLDYITNMTASSYDHINTVNILCDDRRYVEGIIEKKMPKGIYRIYFPVFEQTADRNFSYFEENAEYYIPTG